MARVEALVSALEATTENIRQAVALFAINRAPSTDKELLSKFTNTSAAHVFNFLRNQNSLATILALGRIWDSTESAQSVPNLLPFLKGARDTRRDCCAPPGSNVVDPERGDRSGRE